MNHYLSRLVHWVNGEGEDPAAVMSQVVKACKKVESDCEIFL